MSAETKAALDTALENHIANECGGSILTGYVLHASYLNPGMDTNSVSGYFADYADGQPRHVCIGLAQMHLTYLLSTVYEREDEDD